MGKQRVGGDAATGEGDTRQGWDRGSSFTPADIENLPEDK